LRAVAGTNFLGGPRVRALEAAWAAYFGVRHAVSFNSLTSGLWAAVGAAGIGPGDEVIVSPFTMVASATCPLPWGGIPVFADIDPHSYCLDPASVVAQITPRTRAIVLVHLFGYPGELDEILAIARRHRLILIEDCAQAPAAKYKGRYVGGFGDIGGFSLNYHKTIHSGEGGVMVTNDDDLALRLQLIRNHGEACVADLAVERIGNTFGGNLRMTELEAAVAGEQLKKLDWLTDARVSLARYLDAKLAGIPGITPQRLRHEGDQHAYYFYAMRYDAGVTGLPLDVFVRAVRAEGIELRTGYARPIYWEPLFQSKIAFAKGQYPFDLADRPLSYARGLCPVTEEAHLHSLMFGKFCRWPLTPAHMDQVAAAFTKVLACRHELARLGD
jgi:dTDP-4-amino-4,6-dideoxygalactose transaminase